jgi:PAS domain S-box-containing protein
MFWKRTPGFFLPAISFLIFLAVGVGANSAATMPGDSITLSRFSRIVVLHSYHHGFTWSDSISKGIQSVFSEKMKGAEIKFEFLDTRFNALESYLQKVEETLRAKYSARSVDVIIACDDHALNFMLSHGYSIFPSVPVVFCSVSGYEPQMRKRLTLTGLRESIDIRSTVETALRFHPETERVAVVLDTSRTGKALKKKAAEALSNLSSRIRIDFIEDLTVEQLKRTLPGLPEKTVVLLFIFKPDETGRVLSHEQNLERLYPHCPFPIYGVWQFYLGHGIVGGRLSNGYQEGRMAANMAIRIIEGEDAADIPLGESPVKFMFDHVQLERFGIDSALLPKGSFVLNKPFSFYESYKALIWSVVTTFVLLIAVIVSLFINVYARRRAEKTLRESEEKYRQLIENAGDAIFIAQDGFIKFWNNRTSELLGYDSEELKSISLVEFIHPDDRNTVINRHLRRVAGETGLPTTYSFRIISKDGTERVAQLNTVLIEWQGKPATLNFVRDITAQRKLEASLYQAQKMEAVGTLAAGIAHDFNNLLMGVQGRASLMAVDLENSHPHSEHISAIEDYIQSATNLTKQLLGFSRVGKYEVQAVDINELLIESSAMFGRTKKEIRINTKLHNPPPVVEADRSQIEQVLINLYVNAWQAMPEGGNLHLETQIVLLDELETEPHGVLPGEYTKVSITDTGIGIEESNLQRIFDPFFTTKEKERGTGLGLASAYGIIKNHSGIITVYSEIGHGTTFNIYLPVINEPAQKREFISTGIVSGSETVLLVDDEEMIIEVVQPLLEKLGYRVLVARSGEHAVKMMNELGEGIDLVILDLIMPGIKGDQAFDLIREIQPKIPILLSSGYAINGQATEIMKKGCNGFIQKPFNLSQLSQKVRKILDDAKSAVQE